MIWKNHKNHRNHTNTGIQGTFKSLWINGRIMLQMNGLWLFKKYLFRQQLI